MTREEIIAITSDFLSEEFEVETSEIVPEGSLKEILGLDSLDFVDLVVFIESHFGFKVKPEDFATMITFNDFYNYIEKHLKN